MNISIEKSFPFDWLIYGLLAGIAVLIVIPAVVIINIWQLWKGSDNQ